jgi:hypothetical protein
VAALLLVSLLPVSFATAFSTARHTSSFADWLETQLQDPTNEAVVEALAEVATHRTRSLEVFVRDFIDAYEAQHPDVSAARVLAGMDLSDEALIAYLESRYMGLVGHGVLPRLLLKAQVLTSTLSKRLGTSSSVLANKQQQHRIWTTMWQHAMRPVVVVTLRQLSSAQPLGP